jgi:hypothetical protein
LHVRKVKTGSPGQLPRVLLGDDGEHATLDAEM